MARVDYYDLELEVQRALQGATALDGVTVEVEEPWPENIEASPWVGIYLQRRDDAGSNIAAGRHQRFQIRLELWCVEHSLESVGDAARLRDDLMGRVEVVLLQENAGNLRGKVEMLRIMGGAFESARGESGFWMGGSILLDLWKAATSS